MDRYFLAIPLPEQANDRLVAAQPPAVPGVRLVARPDFHLTVHFLGQLPLRSVDVIRKALETWNIDAFTITIQGVGKFPPKGQPRVLWAGLNPSTALSRLHHELGTVLTTAIGFQPEPRPYSPHVTLARLNQPVSSEVIDRFFETGKILDIRNVPVEQIVLYSSVLTNRIPKYREEAILKRNPCCVDRRG
jgi:2'-5' RNA ligase